MNVSLPFILIILLSFAGCVGTVQEAGTDNTLRVENPPTTFNYSGITVARAVSHNKIEIEFYPISGEENTYRLYVNNAENPITIDPLSLFATTGGRLLYTIDNLLPDREYKLKLRAFKKDSSESVNEAEVYTRTFDNLTANFKGVSKVSLLPGNTSGGIQIDWIAPTMSGIFTSGPFDPVHYEVSVISQIGGAPNLNNSTYSGSDKIVRNVPAPPARANPLSNPNSTVIEGLMPNTTYFVQVRAINTLWMNYFENPDVTVIPVNREVNTRYLSVRTSSNDNLFDFNQSTIVLANAPGADAFDKIDVFWQPGSGNFTGYRVFVRKYTGIGDAASDDQLTEANLQSMNLSGNYFSVNSSLTSRRITGLDNGGYYQVKVALCKTVACPVQASSPDAAIISDLTSIRVKPTLAPFGGINAIVPPGQFSEIDIVTLKFDAPLVSLGYATTVEFFCVDPSDYTQMVKFNGTSPITGSGISRCDGLSLSGTVPTLDTYTSQKVRGLNNSGTNEYCFAAGPAIIGYGADVRNLQSDLIVRCAYPEVLPPTVAQFPGITGSCSLTDLDARINWNLPGGGIYSHFKVFWRLKEEANKFSFSEAISNTAGYSSSALLPATATNYTIGNLMPGEIYQIGVLSLAQMAAPSPDLYSEFNLKVIDCAVPLPIATFKGFTRIFAVGPKLDGRMVNDPSTKSLGENAALYEAVNTDGIPYEVAMASDTAPSLTTNFMVPPGRDVGTSFGSLFDGIGNDAGVALSKTGMISLAWEEPEMSFPAAQTLFAANQPASPSPRANRKWGYKIYRSSDNKLTWQELSLGSGLIYSTPYTYRKRPSATAINARMAFFTDYSVKALYDVHDAANGREVDRARIYFYKIVPIFNGKTLSYSSLNPSIVKVTLPPPNMALVHRWMSNRAHCLSLEKTPNVNDNYTCSYNGLGARPAGFPNRVGNTIIDQKGDLLVDRNELACRYTRGESTALPEIGASNFYLPSAALRNPGTDNNFYPLFKGFRTISEVEDTTTPFRGCVGLASRNVGATSSGDDYPTGFIANHRKFLQGDCMGNHRDTINPGVCLASSYPVGIAAHPINVPGASERNTAPDCSMNVPTNPTIGNDRYGFNQNPNFVMHSEFLGVYWNTNSESGRHYGVAGPATTSLQDSANLRTNTLTGYESTIASQCYVNLAAIDGSGYMKPRWIDLNDAGHGKIRFKGTEQVLLTKTVAELTEVRATTNSADRTLYNGTDGDFTTAAWRLPSSSLRSSSRYRETTQLSRIMTSNGSKLPPLGRLNKHTAQLVCSTYWVQTGTASDNGNFLPTAAPANKRLLRKTESVSASAWPDHLDNNTIRDIEISDNPGSCNGIDKSVSGQDLQKGDFLENRSAVYNLANRYLLTGSSPYHGVPGYTDTTHSASCISRYGIQDMVGNLREHNSEDIFCDYSQDRIYMGQVTPAWSGGTGAENQGSGGIDLNLFNTNTQRHSLALVRSGTLLDGTSVSFTINFRDGSPSMNDLKPWIRVSTDSGYCSIVDDNPVKRTGAVDFFKDVATGFWSPLYVPGGALNTSIIARPQDDQRAVETLRNGDARYADFGVSGILPPLAKDDSLALRTNPMAKYFNPVTGLPLSCNDGACEDPALASPNDNTAISSTALMPNITSLDLTPTMSDYPLRMSEITSTGVSGYSYSSTGYQTALEARGAATYNYLISATADDPDTLANLTYDTRSREDFVPNSPIEFYRVTWTLPRNAVLNFTSGGGSNERNGRYTASTLPNRVIDPGITYNDNSSMGSSLTGARCAVLINEEL